MADPRARPAKMVTAEIALGAGDWQMKAKVTLPAEPVRDADLLPIIRSISEAVNARTIEAVGNAGEQISCCAGCGACCRHLVAISEIEARQLAATIEQLPDSQREIVKQRFADALAALEDAGVLGDVRRMREMTDEQYAELAERYFLARVPCPLLENESCSIHPIRPITCREYLVTSPPVYCEIPKPESIRRVRVLLPVFSALTQWRSGPTERMTERWVPLVAALEWVAANPEETELKPGPELLAGFLKTLAEFEGSAPAPGIVGTNASAG